MDLLGRAKKWVKGMAPAEAAEPQPFCVACPEGHVIRGRRTEGYQAIRCPECGAGVFVLPRSPLPLPPTPAARAEAAAIAGGAHDDAPIALADHVPAAVEDEGEVDWLEPVEPGTGSPAGPSPRYDPVEAAVADLPVESDVPPPSRRPSPGDRAAPRGRPAAAAARPSRPVAARGRQVDLDDRPTFGDRLRRNRPVLVGLAVVGVLVGTVAWSVYRNQRRDYPALVQLGRDEGIPALEAGDFDRAHRLLSRAAAAVEALGGQIGGAEEVRQAAREAAIYVNLVPDRLEEILERRARSTDEAQWQSQFDRSYKGRAILLSAEVVGTPESPAGRFEVNYQILADGPSQPRRARIDFEGFRLFEVASPRVGSRIQFGARLAAIEPDADGWRFRLQPTSGVTITRQESLRALGWTPIETAATAPPPRPAPLLWAILLTPPPPQGLGGETTDRVLQQLGAPRSFARSASLGAYVEQWLYDGPSGSRQYINFVRSTGRSGPAVVHRQYFLR